MRHLSRHFIIGCCLLAIAVCAAEGAEGDALPLFDASRAFAHARALVEIGPRPASSPGSERAQAYIINELARNGAEVREQQFIAETPLGRAKMENIIGVIPGPLDAVVIIGAHYDTKLIGAFPFVGANDGASGVAVLLELARVLPARKNPATIWLVFFDGEEALASYSNSDGLHGSTYMADQLSKSGEIAKVKAMILLDMVGDAHLSIEAESRSTKWLRKIVWENAGKLGHAAYFTSNPTRILDDHVPFLDRGVPSLDIIDFHYGPGSKTNEYWHSPEDTLDKVSPRSLKIVGDVVLESLPEIIKRSKPDRRR